MEIDHDMSVVRRRIAQYIACCPLLDMPHANASQLAFAMLPPGDTLAQLSSEEKKAATEMWESVLGKRVRE